MSLDNKRDDEIKSGSGVSGSTENIDASSGFHYIDDDPGFKLDELMEQYRPSHISPAWKKTTEDRSGKMSINDLFNIVDSEISDAITVSDDMSEDVPAFADEEPAAEDAADEDDSENVDAFDDDTFIGATEEAADEAADVVEDAADEISDGLDEIKDEAEETFEEAPEEFDDAADEITDEAEDAFESLGDTIEFTPARAEETAEEAADDADVIIGDGIDDIRLDMTLDDLLLELDGGIGNSESKPYPNEVFDDDADTDAEVSMDDVAISHDAYTDDRDNNDADGETDISSDVSDGGETADANNEATDNNPEENAEPDESGDPVKYEDVVIDDFFSEKKSRYGDIPFEDVFVGEPKKKNEDSYLFAGIRLDHEAAAELGEDETEEKSDEVNENDIPLDDIKLDDAEIEEILDENAPDEEDVQPVLTDDTKRPRTKAAAYDADKDDSFLDDDVFDDADTEPVPAEENDSAADADDGASKDSSQNIDSTDINLLVAFGLEDELEKTMGADAARRVRNAIDAEQEEHDENKRREFEYEFSDRSQIPGIVEAYKSTKKSTLIKLAISAFLAVIIFFFENLPLFGVQFSGALDPAVYPVVFTMVGLQLLLFCCVCAYEQILGGLAKLFSGHPCPESITSVLVLMSIIYSALVALNVDAGYEPKLYNFPVAIAVVFTLLLAYLSIKREMYSFNIVASKMPKYAVSRKRVDDITVYGGDADEEANDILEVRRVSFIKSYFARTYADSSVVSATVTIIISLALAASALIGVYVGITTGSVMQTLEAVFMTLVVAAPISLLVTYSYPFFCANKKAHGDNATIIGESSLEEYSDASVVLVEDKIVFPPSETKIQNIRIYNNNRIDSVLYYVSSVFAKVGGPLADMFKLSTVETGTSADVTVTENAVGCLAADVDGHHVVLGRVDELGARGLGVDPAITAEDSIMTEENVVMYMFIDGKLAAKMFIRYGISPDLPEIAESLADNGMSLCITTSDPNIDDGIVSARMPIDEFPAKVIKLPVDYERDASGDELDSGIVSHGSADTLLRTVTYCSKILSVRKTNFSIAIFSLFIGVAVMLLLALFGKLSVMTSLLVVVYQLIWTVPVAVTSRLFIK